MSPALAKIWQDQGFKDQTPIQAAVYEPLKNDRSLVGLAPTGSGKTLAFTIPLLEKIVPGDGLQVLILVPSQELAIQMRDVIQPFSKAVDAKVLAITGKANVKRQIEKLKDRPEIIVATAGRLQELIEQNKIKMHDLQTIVVDEADDLLQANAIDDIRHIVDFAPSDIQMAFFSATKAPILDQLEQWFGLKIEMIDVRSIDQTQGEVDHVEIKASNQAKPTILKQFARNKDNHALVFFNKNSSLNFVLARLMHDHVSVASLQSSGRKMDRQNALRQFRQGKIQLLLTTDLAARGLDINDLPAVINYELPHEVNTYLHRAGRTGRMGRDGVVINLGDDHDLRNLRHLLVDHFEFKRRFIVDGELTEKAPKRTSVEMPATKSHGAKTKSTQSTKSKAKHSDSSAGRFEASFKSETGAMPPTKKRNKKRKRDQKNKGYHPKKKQGND